MTKKDPSVKTQLTLTIEKKEAYCFSIFSSLGNKPSGSLARSCWVLTAPSKIKFPLGSVARRNFCPSFSVQCRVPFSSVTTVWFWVEE